MHAARLRRVRELLLGTRVVREQVLMPSGGLSTAGGAHAPPLRRVRGSLLGPRAVRELAPMPSGGLSTALWRGSLDVGPATVAGDRESAPLLAKHQELAVDRHHRETLREALCLFPVTAAGSARVRLTTGQATPKGDASNASWSTEDSTPLAEKKLRLKILALKLRCIAGVARGLVTYVRHDVGPALQFAFECGRLRETFTPSLLMLSFSAALDPEGVGSARVRCGTCVFGGKRDVRSGRGRCRRCSSNYSDGPFG